MAKVKSFGFIPLAEDISKQCSIDIDMWLSLVTLMNVYNERKKTKQGKLQRVKFEEKGSIRKWSGAKSCAVE